MLKLAAKQRMNTDTRRAIFCVIMSGEDYIDAFEQLLSLNLQGKQVCAYSNVFSKLLFLFVAQELKLFLFYFLQDREIMRVLVECCLQEKMFNKYYTALASKLCSHDKNHKFTLQVCPQTVIRSSPLYTTDLKRIKDGELRLRSILRSTSS